MRGKALRRGELTLWCVTLTDVACLRARGRARAVAVGAGFRVGAFVHLGIVEDRPVCRGRVVDARGCREVLGANILVGLRLDELRREGRGGDACVDVRARGERERSEIAKGWAGARGAGGGGEGQTLSSHELEARGVREMRGTAW